MKLLKPIRWKEGMFLRPHHLQQFELYLESRESSRVQTLESYGWGLARLELRSEALANFTLDVAALQAVTPDGALIDVPGNGRLPSRSFEQFMTEPGKPLDVYLGVRAREERRPQVQPPTGGTGASRFLPVEREVFDLDAGEGRAPIEFLEYDLRLFFGEESRQGFEALPLTQVVGTGDPANPVMVERTFAAPAVLLQGAPALHNIARKVLERLSVVQRELGARRHAGDVDDLILYQAVSGYQPVLKDMVYDGLVHPRQVYRELARLAGALFYRAESGRSADEILPYDHRRPGEVFEHLRRLIEELTPKAIALPYNRFPMARSGEEFQIALPEEARKPGARSFIEVLADQSDHLVRPLMMGAKISSASQIAALQSYALPGVPNETLPGPPPEVGRDAKGTYFRLKQEHDDWVNHVIADGNLTVSIRNAPDDLQVALIVILPAG